MAVPLTGQVAITGTAQPLSATPINAVVFTLKASVNNAHSVYIGPASVTTGTGFELAPGESIDYEKNDRSGQPRTQLNVSDFYAVGTAGTDVISWFASPLT